MSLTFGDGQDTLKREGGGGGVETEERREVPRGAGGSDRRTKGRGARPGPLSPRAGMGHHGNDQMAPSAGAMNPGPVTPHQAPTQAPSDGSVASQSQL